MPEESKNKILIVDDMKTNAAILKRTLGEKFETLVAYSGEEALKIAVENPPDLILLDVIMPGLNGYQVCEELKRNKATRDIPVIFITALSEDDNEAEGLKMGAVDYISKPFNPALVKARVENHIELKQYRDSLEAQVAQRTKELSLAKEAAIQSLAFLAEFRDTDTGSHIKRTKSIVKVLAEELSKNRRYAELLSSEQIQFLQLSAPLHDIGKVALPDNILRKKGKLTPQEFETMKEHTLYGADALRRTEEILGGTSFLNIARIIAEYHHEKWDGSGYPHGLAGEAIPLYARIMAVADVYDALISERPYKAAMPHAEACALIEEAAGQHFDPIVVEIFKKAKEEIAEIGRQHTE